MRSSKMLTDKRFVYMYSKCGHFVPVLSLRDRDWGFIPAVMNMKPAYFHSKIELTELPKKIYIEKEITITKR